METNVIQILYEQSCMNDYQWNSFMKIYFKNDCFVSFSKISKELFSFEIVPNLPH
jgi:hypothetical protein